ncbi:MAG: sporulation protein [Corynebacteriales bacterium]|nr:sporulation protein [Mycobacteriales bacterium]
MDTIREVVGDNSTDKVFGEPITQEGLTLLPVAKVSGGGGGGTGPAEHDQEAGGVGGGLGVAAKPLGVYLIKDGKVAWRPALDLNKVIMGGQIVMVVALLTLRALIKARSKRKARK